MWPFWYPVFGLGLYSFNFWWVLFCNNSLENAELDYFSFDIWKYRYKILTVTGVSALGASSSFLRSQYSPFLTETSFVALQESSFTEGFFVWFDYFKARRKYSNGFFFWKPPRKFGELWAFLFLLTPSTLLPASSLQKELRDHRALLVSQRQLSFLAVEGRAAINQSGNECISVACSVGWGQGTEETTYRWGSFVSHEKREVFSTSQEVFTSRREGAEHLGALLEACK